MGEMESGTCIQTGNGLGYTIRRAWSGQGWIYKNVEHFIMRRPGSAMFRKDQTAPIRLRILWS